MVPHESGLDLPFAVRIVAEWNGRLFVAVAEDVGVDPQALVDALVESRASAVDAVLAAGEITEAEAEQYRAALEEAFTFRVTWDGQEATPTFTGPAA